MKLTGILATSVITALALGPGYSATPPALQAQLKAVDFEAVLNYALQENPALPKPPGTP
jgi:hypothetical protein